MWIVDFPAGLSEVEVALYESPFEYVTKVVRPKRAEASAHASAVGPWWEHHRPRSSMREAIWSRSRFLCTTRVAKHRLFVWLPQGTLPDSATIAFSRDDDYFFGVVQSRVHEVWALRLGTQLREAESGFRYTPTTCFETFPLPWPPGSEPTADPLHEAIAEAARSLDSHRSGALANNPDETLTRLYNRKPQWLLDAHRKLDEACLRRLRLAGAPRLAR